jgi:hypothetical protein
MHVKTKHPENYKQFRDQYAELKKGAVIKEEARPRSRSRSPGPGPEGTGEADRAGDRRPL